MPALTDFEAFRDIAKKVNNWGRWGADDELGTLNLITRQAVRDAVATVRTGRRFSLALPLQQQGVQTGMIPGRVNPLHTMVALNWEMFGPGAIATSDDVVTLGLQAATHWDGLGHVSHGNRIYNNRPANTAVTAHEGALHSGVEKAGPVLGRGVLLDVARARGLRRLPPGHLVTTQDLDAAQELARTEVRAGDIVLVRTGQVQLYLGGDRDGYGYPSPGLSLRTPEWFHAHDVAAVANDTLTFEIFPPEIDGLYLPVHALDLVEMGMMQGQNWNLEELAEDCAQDGRYAFLLSAPPEPFTGGVGSPVVPVAVK
ncbi:cyclase family protein [Streptacidiphilus sp. P02-A3a]|uniref:cyclase family protein n=1 Tax=Streptacidiphilus sp. P02-A3a TaxID=2704468 RepID=UPI0015FC7B0A|nr:cyclase family protein [Streptacidiphilus sp. P02-A3a]QMU67529.1 cyclase family protein [Streptacidiphilus sp. P02-A3a]